VFDSAQALWEACCECSFWADQNTIHDQQAHAFRGNVVVSSAPRPRAYTATGLCVFLGTAYETWRRWKDQSSPAFKPDLAEVIDIVLQIMFE